MRVSKTGLFFFVLIYNYLFLRIIIFPYLYDNYGYNALFVILGFLLILIGIFIFIPKELIDNSFVDKYKNSRIKMITNLILLLRIITGVFITVNILFNLFFYEYSFYVLGLGISLVILLLGTLKSHEIIEINTLFGMIVLVCYVFYIYDFIDMDFNLIFRNINYNFDYLSIILLLCLFLDNIYYFLIDKDKINFNKKTIIFSILLSFILFTFEYFILLLSSGNKLFLNDYLSGFKALSIAPVSRYNGNFDYIYILLIGVSSVFKYSFYLSIINNSIIYKKRYFGYYLLIIMSGLYLIRYVFNLNISIVNYWIIGLLLLGIILLIWMFGVIVNVKKIKRN